MEKKTINQLLKKLRTILPQVSEYAKIEQIVVGEDTTIIITPFEYKIVPLRELKGMYEGYELVPTPDTIYLKKDTNDFLKQLGGLVFYLIFGLFLSLILNKKILGMIYKYVNLSTFSPAIYNIRTGSFFLTRLAFFLIGVFLWVLTPYLISIEVLNRLHYNDTGPSSYDWKKLYDSLKKEGYAPNKFKEGYINVENINNSYHITNGNHRHGILLHLYKENLPIKVKVITGESTTIKLT